MTHLAAVDAGGTNSRAAVLCLETGLLSIARAEGANWTVHGPDLCRERITRALSDALPAGAAPAAVTACVAGYYPPDHAEAALAWLAETWPGIPARILPDVVGAWAGALAGEPGLVLISGTGSICYGRNSAGAEARAGGWGPLYSDEGSAYTVGIAALRALADYADELGPETALAERFMERWPEVGAELRGWLRGIYRTGWAREHVAGLAREVVSAAEGGDAVAARLIQGAAADLARLAAGVAARLGESHLPVALQGGLGACNTLQAAVRAALADAGGGLRLIPARFEPLEGALLLAAEQWGGVDARRRARDILEARAQALGKQ